MEKQLWGHSRKPMAPGGGYLEILLVFGLSLGRSAVYAVVALAELLSRPAPLAKQSTALNTSESARPVFDLIYQLLSIGFALVPVALACFFLALELAYVAAVGNQAPATGVTATVPPAFLRASLRQGARTIGLDLQRFWQNLGHGALLALGIGLPGLAFYVLGRQLGLTVQVQAAGLPALWWSVAVLILHAAKNAILEEALVTGYLLHRLQGLGWRWLPATLASALLRGAYHLYQGIGPFFGNMVMGLVFNEYFRRRLRVMPLIWAHTFIDVVAFVGWHFLPEAWLAWL